MQPVDFLRELSAAPFTGEDMPPQLSAYAMAYAKQTGIDPSICALSAVVVAASALADDFTIVADPGTGWSQSARLWGLVVAPSGAGKSPAQRAMLNPLHSIQRELYVQHQRALEAIAADEEKPPRPWRVLSDSTVEALSEALRDHPRGLLMANDELEGFMGSLDQYKRGAASRDRGEWLRLFDGGPHTVERIQRGSVFVPNFGASLLTATTPTALAKMARLLPEDGLLQRFLVVAARRQQDGEIVQGIEAVRSDYDATIARLFELQPRENGGAVQMMRMTRELFESWRKQQRVAQEAFDGVDPSLGSHIAKFPTFLLRIALVFHSVLHLNREDPKQRDPAAWPLLPETLQLATRFLDRCSKHALAVYLHLRGGSDAFDLTKEVARCVLALPKNVIERRDLLRQCRAFTKADPAEQRRAMALLVDMGWLAVDDSGYQKDYATRWAVNPSLRERFAAAAERERERRAVIREFIQEAANARR